MPTIPTQPPTPKQTIYDITSTKPRLPLRKVIDKIAEFLEANNISWAGIELKPIDHKGHLSPGTSKMPPAGKSLQIYVKDPEEPTSVSYLFQQSGFVTDHLPDEIERVEFIQIQHDSESLTSSRKRGQSRDSEGE